MIDYLRYLTSTVGLVTCRAGAGTNVMSAEWTYFVARRPLHVMIGVQDGNWTQHLLVKAGEFGVTLCDTALAPVAGFAGSFTGLEVDKTSSDDIVLDGPHVLSTPYVRGGVLNAECRLVRTVDLPGYRLFIGEAVWAQADDDAFSQPLVKHGSMHALGEALAPHRVVAAASWPNGAEATLLVAATAHGTSGEAARWRVVVSDATSGAELVAADVLDVTGDLLEKVSVPPSSVAGQPLRVRVEREQCAPGTATVRGHSTSPRLSLA